MASQNQSVDLHDLDAQLDREAGFDLLMRMYGSFHDLYERSGGVESVLRDMDGEEAEDSRG